MLGWCLFGFALSQLTLLLVGLCLVGLIVVREYHKGNDLTYWGLGRLIGGVIVCSAMGIFLPILVWAAYQTGDVEVEWPLQFQHNSVYDIVGKEKVLLHGSNSAKVFKNLTGDWEGKW